MFFIDIILQLMRFFITLSFNGAGYHGWQIQPNDPSVQEQLGYCLSKLLHEDILPTGAGRTDAGVHAINYVAHFDSKNLHPSDIDRFVSKLNRFLPADIVVHSIVQVKPEAHARFDAFSRSYKYYISDEKDVFHSAYKWHVRQPLELSAMNKACELIKSCTDFTSFSKLHSDNQTNTCKIEAARWDRENESIVFSITADRFLRNMVRAIVGTMVAIGCGKISPEEILTIIDAKDRGKAGMSAPAQGLFFTGAAYPPQIFIG